jgi:hypothetical protein
MLWKHPLAVLLCISVTTQSLQASAPDLNAEETLAIGNVAVQQQADGSFKAVNGEGTPENLIVDTLALKSESWNEKSEGFRGLAADLMKGIAVAAGSIAQTLDMKAPEIKLGESSSQKDTAITQQSSQLSAGEQLVLAAKDNVTLIGAEVSTEGTAVLSAANVTLEAAAETSTSETSHSEHTVGGMGGKLNKDEVSLGGMKEVKTTETTTTTSTTHKGTALNVGNLAVLATQDVNIVASKVEVEGQAIVQAGGDVNVTGKQDTTSTETRTDIETTTVAVGVRNAYVDAAMSVKALKDAFDALKDADKAYDQAKKRVDSGELAKAALKDYETNRAMAAVNLAQAEIAAAAAIAGAATAAASSMGTGFYVSGSAQKEQTSTSSTQTASTWQGSSIDAGNLSISGQNTTIEGSDITAGWLKLDSDKVLITAGIDQYKDETSSSTKSVSASGGTNGSASASASVSSSKSSSTSLENVNSRINVGHLESDADSLTLRGAEVTAQTADLNVGSLTVQSLQDTSSSSNSSKSTSVGVSNSTSKNGSSQSANVGVNRSSGSSEAQEVGNQTQLLIADGANSQITARDTTLIGGLIANATKNEDGTLTDHGKLNLTTETLTVSDLEDKSKSDQRSTGMQVSTGLTTDEKGKSNFSENGTTTVNLSHSGHKREGETQATLGLGNVTVGGKKVEETNPELNRDVSQAQITTLDQQTGALNASVTVDNKVIIDASKAVAEGVMAVAEGVATVVHAYTKDLPPGMVETLGPEAKALYRKMLMEGLSPEEEQKLDAFVSNAVALEKERIELEALPKGKVILGEPTYTASTEGEFDQAATDAALGESANGEDEGAYDQEPPPERAFKDKAVATLGDADAFLKTLPQDKVAAGEELISFVAGGPAKYALTWARDEISDAIIGETKDEFWNSAKKGIADWSLDYSEVDDARAEKQVAGADLGLRLFGAITGLIPTGKGSHSVGVDKSSENGSGSAGEVGCIYCVKGEKTNSGMDYVGSTDNMENRVRDKSDGRDREGAEIIDTYPKGDRDVRRVKEQEAINARGGVENLDNKRNEVAPSKWQDMGINPPK